MKGAISMKKYITIFLGAVLALSLASCGASGSADSSAPESSEAQTSAAE